MGVYIYNLLFIRLQTNNNILAKMQNWLPKFQFFSFQSSNFYFCHFSLLTFNFCQCGTPLELSQELLLIEPKRRHFGFFFFFNKFQNFKKKSIKNKKINPNQRTQQQRSQKPEEEEAAHTNVFLNRYSRATTLSQQTPKRMGYCKARSFEFLVF